MVHITGMADKKTFAVSIDFAPKLPSQALRTMNERVAKAAKEIITLAQIALMALFAPIAGKLISRVSSHIDTARAYPAMSGIANTIAKRIIRPPPAAI